jgi:hypothetical protein
MINKLQQLSIHSSLTNTGSHRMTRNHKKLFKEMLRMEKEENKFSIQYALNFLQSRGSKTVLKIQDPLVIKKCIENSLTIWGIKGKKVPLKLCNFSWMTSVLAEWKETTIILLTRKINRLKKKDSFCPISLTSITMKSMISARFNWYLEAQNLLTHEQAGLKANHSIEQIFVYQPRQNKVAYKGKKGVTPT